MIDPSRYADLITGQHRDQPKFMATVAALCRPLADIANAAEGLPPRFDLDKAMGDQLDIIGLWVGVGRHLEEPLTGIYFALDTSGVGFDDGIWMGPYDPDTGVTALPDDPYRTLIRARIANNQWDGSIPNARRFLASLFPANTVLIQDHGDMSLSYALLGPVPDAVTWALLTGGYLDLKPAGVRVSGYVMPSIHGSPLFGFDAETGAVAGFDAGAWAVTDLSLISGLALLARERTPLLADDTHYLQAF